MADLNYDDVQKILAILDASTLDEVHIEIGDFKLEVRRRTAGTRMRSPDAEHAPAQPKPAPGPVKAPPPKS
jgi:hypothetical protein